MENAQIQPLHRQAGATVIEYALIVSAIAVVVAGTLHVFGQEMDTMIRHLGAFLTR